LPIFWLCPGFGHANILVGLDGAQSKQAYRLMLSCRPALPVALHICTRPRKGPNKREHQCRRIRRIGTGGPLGVFSVGSASAVSATAGRTTSGRRRPSWADGLYPACRGFELVNSDEAKRSRAGIWMSFLVSVKVCVTSH
jgi:hypothetical protein